ncbi:TetR/AcrR family transcriptional regulator [Subtercola boreus]|nr:TetR/AcrR family transcriptional regulator [Subtercola boreus]
MVGVKKPEGERQDDIIAAARAVALRGGLETVSARTVAAEAQLSSGLVYFHFGSKDGLLQALLRHLMDTALDGPRRGFGQNLSADEAFFSMVANEVAGLNEFRDEADLLFQFYFFRRGTEFRSTINAGLNAYSESMKDVTDRFALEKGLAPDAFRSSLLALIQGAAVDAVRRPTEFDSEQIIQIIQNFSATTQDLNRFT